ncbi:MAG: efflux RND transporter permease subunit, partial [Syntrophales bacterium]|nr:efflux RND transporter permease subunit [Syntrophales bacterium]
ETLHAKAVQIETILESIRGIVDVGVYRELGQPTLNISIDRNQCARFGLNVVDIQNLVLYAIGGNPIASILEGERTFSMALRFPGGDRETLKRIEQLLVDTPDGQRIPLSMVARVELADGPFFIYRESGKRYIAIRFGVRGRDLGSAAAEAQDKVSRMVELPRGYTITWDGQFNQMKTAQFKLAIIIPVTLFVIMLLLYSNFGNVKDAAIVIFNVPFSIIGGVLALYLTGEDLSISAGIGFLCLFGIAIQDGVILISHIRRLWMEQGCDLVTAVVEGASHRLRPVLMTALLAGLGLLPAALSHAIGSQTQRPLALVIVGGMLSTTFLTLLVLPVIFSWVNSRSYKKSIAFEDND